MELRWYQSEAVEAVWNHLRTKPGNPVIELPTGAGKSVVIAELATQAVNKWCGRVLVLQHVKELIGQNAAKLQQLCPTIKVGLYSAGLRKREADAPIVVAGIQTVHTKSAELGRFDLVVIDEAHLVPESGDGMYRRLIGDLQEINSDLVIVGLTATPYRTDSGPICTPDGLLNHICYKVSVKTLIAQGFLSKMIGRRARMEVDTTGIKLRGGEFIESEAADVFMETNEIVAQACQELFWETRDRRSVLVFCQSVEHAGMVFTSLIHHRDMHMNECGRELQKAAIAFEVKSNWQDTDNIDVIADWLEEQGMKNSALRRYLDCKDEFMEVVVGSTEMKERDGAIERFKRGQIKYLINVNVLTTGFDAPNTDCVAIMRATMSPGLFYQMVGRGFRTCADKVNCLVLDYGQNIRRHGPIDEIQPRKARAKGEQDTEPASKECPECRAIVNPATRSCPGCEYIWPEVARTISHDATADGDPLSKTATDEVKQVTSVEYRVHRKANAMDDAPKTLRVTYKCGLADYVSEWVCIEHPEGGFAHQKALKWWRKRCMAPMPKTAAEAVVYALHGLLAEPTEITTRTKKGEKFPEIVKQVLGPVPDEMKGCEKCGQSVTILVRNDERYVPGKLVCGLCSHQLGFVQQEVVNHYGYYDGSLEATGIISEEVFDVYDGVESDPPRNSDDTSKSDLLAAIEGMPADQCPF